MAVTPFITEDDAPLPKRKARPSEVNMKINGRGHVNLCEERRRPCASEDRLARPAEGSPHAGALALLEQHDHDQVR